jgi:nitroreductase
MEQNSKTDLQELLAQRYSDPPTVPDTQVFQFVLDGMAKRGSCRKFQKTPVPNEVLKTLCAVALAAPSKSDLQQRDIVLMTSKASRDQLAALVSGQDWVADAPTIVVFCGNGRRQRQLHDWHDIPFANDHLDSFFNAAIDGAIALGAFVTAAEAIGLGCCPISAIRNDPEAVSDLLTLPDHVFPIAGLAIGYPEQTPTISKRLPLAVTVHHDRFSEVDLKDVIEDYDADRAAKQPYQTQRYTEAFGEDGTYGWSTDKVRQYSQPERSTFGRFVRAKGYRLD